MKTPHYLITQEQLSSIAEMAAEKAVESYRAEEKKIQKKRDNESVRITKQKLAAYRRLKASLAETEEFTDDEKIELRWAFVKDLMGSGLEVIGRAENRIRSVENRRKRESFEVQLIEKAMDLYRKEAEKSTTEEEKRRYRELYAAYIDEVPMSIKEIADTERISEKIVYRDLGIATQILSVYLLGM